MQWCWCEFYTTPHHTTPKQVAWCGVGVSYSTEIYTGVFTPVLHLVVLVFQTPHQWRHPVTHDRSFVTQVFWIILVIVASATKILHNRIEYTALTKCKYIVKEYSQKRHEYKYRWQFQKTQWSLKQQNFHRFLTFGRDDFVIEFISLDNEWISFPIMKTVQ